MPQNRHDGRNKAFRKGQVIRSKFRIGVRASGRNAHEMSNEDLLKVATKSDKYAQKARNMLTRRGVTV